jgi:hypothetical protein
MQTLINNIIHSWNFSSSLIDIGQLGIQVEDSNSILLKGFSHAPTIGLFGYFFSFGPASYYAIARGEKVIKHLISSIGLFKMSNTCRIKMSFKEWPQNAYICSHHRFPISGSDSLLQQIVTSLFEKHETIVGGHMWLLHFVALCKHIFHARNISKLSTDMRFWDIVRAMEDKKAVVVYPAREGALHEEDFNMSFREGLFAASIFTNTKIIDFVVFKFC